MKLIKTDTPDVTDAAAKEKTGTTLKEWFKLLDGKDALAAGRRETVHWIYDGDGKDEWWAVTIAVEYEKAKGQREKDGKPKGYSICATKTIAAPLAKVFAAFGEAKALDRWLGPKTKVQFTDGGKFEDSDGDRGTYTRIRKDKDIRFTWDHPKLAPGTQVEVLFADKGKGKTGITLNHTRIQTRREADQVRAGWGAAFDELKGLLEKA